MFSFVFVAASNASWHFSNGKVLEMMREVSKEFFANSSIAVVTSLITYMRVPMISVSGLGHLPS